MINFYLLSIIPIVIGSVLWYKNKEIIWKEWLLGSFIAICISFLFHMILLFGMTADTETWSGVVYELEYHPEWVEKYTVTENDSKGNSRSVTKHRTHSPYWLCFSNFGEISEEKDITKEKYDEIKKHFGDEIIKEEEFKMGFSSGDPNIYITKNKTDYICPVTTKKIFENKIKSSPSVFSYSKVDEKIKVFNYPKNSNFFSSGRLIGESKKAIDILEFDRLNSYLGPRKKVNLIIVGFNSLDSKLGQFQEAKWIGGKKNDLVLCYGGESPSKAEWSYVFGWTEKEIVKSNLESILLNNKIDNSILEKIKNEVIKNYEIKDWDKFDYISVEPPLFSYFIFIFIMIAFQVFFYIKAHNN